MVPWFNNYDSPLGYEWYTFDRAGDIHLARGDLMLGQMLYVVQRSYNDNTYSI